MSEYYHGDRVMCIIEEFKLDFLTGQVCKYILRAGNKPENSELRDLQKAKWYLDRKIKALAPPEDTIEVLDANKLSLAINAVNILIEEAREARAAIRHALQVIEECAEHRGYDSKEERAACIVACKKVLLTDRANRFPWVL